MQPISSLLLIFLPLAIIVIYFLIYLILNIVARCCCYDGLGDYLESREEKRKALYNFSKKSRQNAEERRKQEKREENNYM